MMMDESPELIGVGAALVDLLLEIDDATLAAQVPGAKGGMELVESEEIERILAAVQATPAIAAGGAASNTTVGVAALGLRSAFVGACGRDELAGFYRAALERQGCKPLLTAHDFLPTGRVLSLVTPDAERTMRTCLGAAAAQDPAAITAELFAGARVVMLEGYALFNHDLARAVAEAAKDAGCALALDLASFEVVQANRDVLEELLSGPVDLVFANETEATAWAGGVEPALRDLSCRCRVAVVKVGADGAWVAGDGCINRVAAQSVQAVDSTGAGDCWAAGFLAGWLRGLPLPAAAELGARCGAAVVQVMGAQLPASTWHGLRGWLDAWR